MYDFNYQRATTVADASAKIKASDDGMLMAGGMTLIPTLKQRLAQPADVIDLGGISDLIGISVDGDIESLISTTPPSITTPRSRLIISLSGSSTTN